MKLNSSKVVGFFMFVKFIIWKTGEKRLEKMLGTAVYCHYGGAVSASIDVVNGQWLRGLFSAVSQLS